ncbi:MAG: GC-type dockerin domain-anchored protein, partial [Phycisphaerales bacterium JB041]
IAIAPGVSTPLTSHPAKETSHAGSGASASDFTLVELDEAPDPAWEVSFAGWDVSGVDTPGAIAIHHPDVDEKRISFEFDPTATTSYLGNSIPGDGTHVRVLDWDIGTTEPGSSGSPLFDENHRVIGQLHGGYAACGNDLADWYGKMSVSWDAGSSSSSRLRDWLDPTNSGATVVDTLWPSDSGLRVIPGGTFVAEGPSGGPFSPASQVYTLRNSSDFPINYTVSTSAGWLDISSTSGTIAVDGMVDVTVTINSTADGFSNGGYDATIDFANTTDGDGDTSRAVRLFVGVPEPVYMWNMNTNPGWTTEAAWAWGRPTGGGGEHGNNDPTSGATGNNVMGYNLSGDYTNNMPERHMTTMAIDCSELSRTSLRFQRYLNVEQPAYDHAYIRVSTDGSNWDEIWTNGSEITDSSWNLVEYDISEYADGEETVYIRWTQGTTDSSWLYSGWNIDDVEIWGVVADSGCAGDFNGDGDVNTLDVLDFLNAWNAGEASGDFNEDGDINTLDVLDFLNAWNAGC